MSIDTHMQIRTPLSAEQVRAALVHDPALTDLGLAQVPGVCEIDSRPLNVVVRPWDEEDGDLIDGGFETATVRVKLIPKWGEDKWTALYRVVAAIMRLVPGDVCLSNQDSAGPDVLRLGETVYINPDWYRPENLTGYSYTPEHLVVGIPARTAEVAAQ